MPANSHDERDTAGARGEGRAGGPAEERDAHLALLALGGVFAITVAWWTLDLWPVPGGNPEWLERARVVCFNAGPDGLPDVSGWMLLIGQPLGLFGFLPVVMSAEEHPWLGQEPAPLGLVDQRGAVVDLWEFAEPHDHVLSGPVEEVEATLDQWNVARSRNPRTGDVAHPSLTYLLTAETTIAFATLGGREVMIGLARRVEAKR